MSQGSTPEPFWTYSSATTPTVLNKAGSQASKKPSAKAWRGFRPNPPAWVHAAVLSPGLGPRRQPPLPTARGSSALFCPLLCAEAYITVRSSSGGTPAAG